MIFSLGKIRIHFLRNTMFLLPWLTLSCLAPAAIAQTYSAADASAQVEAWRAVASQARSAGKTAEAAQAEENIRRWQAIAAQSQGSEPNTEAASTDTEPKKKEVWRPEAPLNPDYQRNLQRAVSNQNQNRVRMLLDRGAQGTPRLLKMALDNQNAGIAFLLVNGGAGSDPELQDHLGRALLQAAGNSSNANFLDALIRLGVDINYEANDSTATSIALSSGNYEMLRLLIARGARQDMGELSRLLFEVAESGESNRARQLVSAGANPAMKVDGETAIESAFQRADFEMVKALTSGGLRIDQSVLTDALLRAVGKNQMERVRQLVALGADVNAASDKGVRPLMVALYNENLTMAEMLIRSGASDPEGHYANKTFDAALNGDVEWLRVLAQVPSYADYRNGQGETPLHAAASRGQTAAVNTLVNAGINPNVLTSLKNWTPLHHAARFGHMETVKALLRLGANAHAVNSDGNDALRLVLLAREGLTSEAAVRNEQLANFLELWKKNHPPGQ